MGIAAGMKDITRDIASSYEARIAEVGRLKKEADEMLGSFQASHKEMSAGLRRDLARDNARMGAEVRAMRNAFRTSHKKMSLAVRKDLAEHAQSVRGKVTKMRQETIASHQDMSAKLRKDLAQGETERKQAGAELKKDLTQSVSARKSEVKGMRNGFQTAHNEMGAQLRKELANYDRGIKREVSGMRQETIADLGGARTAWQGLASTMQVKRAGVKVSPKAAVAEEEIPDLEAKLLEAVNEHPKGVTLAKVAHSLGIAPVVLARASKSLLRKGEIRKEEKFYFPVGAK